MPNDARSRCLAIFDEHAFAVSLPAAESEPEPTTAIVCNAQLTLPLFLESSQSMELETLDTDPSVTAASLISLAARIWSAAELQHMQLCCAAAKSNSELWSRTQFEHVCLELLPQFRGPAVPFAEEPEPESMVKSTPHSLASLGPPPVFALPPPPVIPNSLTHALSGKPFSGQAALFGTFRTSFFAQSPPLSNEVYCNCAPSAFKPRSR